MIFKREKVKFTYKKKKGDEHGHYKAKLKKVSDEHLKDLKREIGKEQIRRKEAQPLGKAEQSKIPFGAKLRRFIRRVSSEIQYHAETTAVNHIVGSEQAASLPYINLIDETAQ